MNSSLSGLIGKILKYTFFWFLLVWLLLSGSVFYRYIFEVSSKTIAKWGTFVEAIFDTITFLPYTNMKGNNSFYKGLLFNSCIKASSDWWSQKFEDDLCKVTTTDYRNYFVKLKTDDRKWSDWVPVTLDDIKFTYETIIKDNVRKVADLQPYNKLEVALTNDKRLRVSFPNSSIDNILFFTNFILPQHKLHSTDFESYVAEFSRNPVRTNCAKLEPQNKDPNSLIFNLLECPSSSLNYYQIKSFKSFEAFQKSFAQSQQSIIDMYSYPQNLSGYDWYNAVLSSYMTLFFNNTSRRINTPIKEWLISLINSDFYSEGFQAFLKRDHSLFNSRQIQWKNILKPLQEFNPSDELNKQDFDKLNIAPLPWEISIKNRNNKNTYYSNELINNKNIRILLDREFDKITVSYNWWPDITTKTFDKKKRITFYNIWTDQNNLQYGLNTYKIKAYRGKNSYNIMDINFYVIEEGEDISSSWAIDDVDPARKIKIIYQKEPNSYFVVNRLVEIFKKKWINKYFVFLGYTDTAELEGKIVTEDYDIVIRSINLAWKQDISPLFLTDSPAVNPTFFKNPDFAGFINQYYYSTQKTQEIVKSEIDKIYASELPLIILGKNITPIYLRSSFKGFKPDSLQLYESTLREYLFNNIKLVHGIDLDRNVIFNYGNFLHFLMQATGQTGSLTPESSSGTTL